MILVNFNAFIFTAIPNIHPVDNIGADIVLILVRYHTRIMNDQQSLEIYHSNFLFKQFPCLRRKYLIRITKHLHRNSSCIQQCDKNYVLEK